LEKQINQNKILQFVPITVDRQNGFVKLFFDLGPELRRDRLGTRPPETVQNETNADRTA